MRISDWSSDVCSSDLVGRGLYGPLIIEEPGPLRVDREVTWVLDDWRLTKSAEISDDFGNGHDMSHHGRVGNTVTIHGKVQDDFGVQQGARLRLRLVNGWNSGLFAPHFHGPEPAI